VTELRFTVIGVPIPQGSMKSFVVRRKRDGKMIATTTGDNPLTKGWRQVIAETAARELRQAQYRGLYFTGAVEFDVTFWLPRPLKYLSGKYAGREQATARRGRCVVADRVGRRFADHRPARAETLLRLS
jgi:hypothetical protein